MEFYHKLDTVMSHFSKSGGFLTVKSGDKVNTMTISWGFIGFLWGKPHFITLVRPTRYTHTLLETADSFTVSVPFGTKASELSFCGSSSGATVDKSRTVTFISSKNVESPIVEGCDMYYECKIDYRETMKDSLIPKSILETMYKNDLHDIYIGEIVNCY
ncbi:MAG: flavin reductase family protein [Clostridiales bacterium]|jgi:flavin reductase (DIM6/NTAB) family NADH-FMN oxidoreductase RutF|nr:flavin reductase family protein [Clostridiales bacterium]